MFNAVDEAVTVADEDGFIIEANDAVDRVYRWPKAELVGRHPLKFCPMADELNWEKLSRKIWTCIQRTGQFNGVVINHDREKKRFPILLKVRTIKLKEAKYILSFAKPFPANAPFGLSPCQAATFSFLGQGLEPKEIAAKVHSKESTVRTHLKRIYLKAFKSDLGFDLKKLMTLALRCHEAGWNSEMRLENKTILREL